MQEAKRIWALEGGTFFRFRDRVYMLHPKKRTMRVSACADEYLAFEWPSMLRVGFRGTQDVLIGLIEPSSDDRQAFLELIKNMKNA